MSPLVPCSDITFTSVLPVSLIRLVRRAALATKSPRLSHSPRSPKALFTPRCATGSIYRRAAPFSSLKRPRVEFTPKIPLSTVPHYLHFSSCVASPNNDAVPLAV